MSISDTVEDKETEVKRRPSTRASDSLALRALDVDECNGSVVAGVFFEFCVDGSKKSMKGASGVAGGVG